MERTGLNMRGADGQGYNFFWIGGNYSMLPGGTLASSGNRYIGDISWYTTGVGRVGVEASQASNADSNAATPVDQSFSVARPSAAPPSNLPDVAHDFTHQDENYRYFIK